MMARIYAYLRFNGECRKAMTFYRQCFGGELTLMRSGDSPMADQVPHSLHNNIFHSKLSNGGLNLMASDSFPPLERIAGNAVSLSVECESEKELRTLFSRLSDGGEVTVPLGKPFWGGLYGMISDKFGISWVLIYEE